MTHGMDSPTLHHMAIAQVPSWSYLSFIFPAPLGNGLIVSNHFTQTQYKLELPLGTSFCSTLHHGLGLPNPMWEQGIMAIKLFLEHANSFRIESTLITTSMEYTQLQLGSSLQVFENNFSKWGFLMEPTWITSIWQFILNHHIQLQSFNMKVPEPPRLHDRFIMEIAMESGLSDTELSAINQCRLAHQALFLLDVTTGWGDHICPHLALLVKPHNQSSWKWPLERPSKSDWSIWFKFLQNSAATLDFTLIHRLGQWLNKSHWLNIIPYDPTTCMAFLSSHSNYWVTYCGIS